MVRDFLARSCTHSFQINCAYCQCGGDKQSVTPASGVTDLHGWHTTYLRTLWRKWFGVASLTQKNIKESNVYLEIFWPGGSSSSISSVEIQYVSLQLCSHPAVKWILHKHFKCRKNKMCVRTISISSIQAHKYALWMTKTHTTIGKNGKTQEQLNTFKNLTVVVMLMLTEFFALSQWWKQGSNRTAFRA